MAYMPSFRQRMGDRQPYMFDDMRRKTMPMRPLSATQALDRATTTAKPAATGLSAGLGAAGAAVTGNPIGALATLGQGVAGVVGSVQERDKYRDLKDAARDRARTGDPAAKARLSSALRQLGTRSKLARQQMGAELSRTGGPGRALLTSRLAGDESRAIADIQGSVGAQDAEYRNRARQEAAQYRMAEGQAAGDIARSVGSAFGMAGQFVAGEQAKQAEADRFQAAQALREETNALRRLGMEQGQQQFEAGQELTRDLASAGRQERGMRAAQERDLERRRGDRENLRYATERGEQRQQFQDEMAFEREMDQRDFQQQKEIEVLKAALDGSGQPATVGAFPKLDQFDNWLQDRYEGMSVQGALEQAYANNNYEDIALLYGNLKQHYGLDIPHTNKMIVDAVKVLNSPEADEQIKAQAQADIADALQRLNAEQDPSRIGMLSPLARDAYYGYTGSGPRAQSLTGRSMQATGEAAEKNPFGFALYGTKFK